MIPEKPWGEWIIRYLLYLLSSYTRFNSKKSHAIQRLKTGSNNTMNELNILRCHKYYFQYLTVAYVEFQTFIPLISSDLLFLTNFSYNWSTGYLFEITNSQGYICKSSCQHNAEILFYTFSVSILNIENHNVCNKYGCPFGNRCTLEICKSCINQMMRSICQGLIPRNHTYPNRLNKESTALKQK